MWGNTEKQGKTVTSSVDTLVGRQTEVHGDVRFTGGLHLDGTIKGKILADGKDAVLSISESGKVEGDVRVPNLVLNGVIQGDVYATQRLNLSSKGRVNGNVYYKVIEMNSGATINGQLVHETAEPQALTHDKQDKSRKVVPLTNTEEVSG
ncbi:MAG: polymer-forming cytoskeletal protein [Acidobacteria bacterium]|nr:polymer-forming cytoskeletal protein [Acidobacteriota bacterium]